MMQLRLMVIRYFDIFRSVAGPAKDDSPLPVDTDAMFSFQVPLKRLKPVSRRRFQVIQ
jgi:hypothetical protein